MGGDRKKDLTTLLDQILIELENGNLPVDFDLQGIDISSIEKEEAQKLINKIDYVIQKISEKQAEILKSISDKTELKGYRF